MTKIFHFIDALKIAWLKRYMNADNHGKWKNIFRNELSKIGENWILSCKPSCNADFDYDKICITFLKDVLKSWFKLRNACYEKGNDALWYNSYIIIDKKTGFYEKWSSVGVNFVSDLIKNNLWMSYERVSREKVVKAMKEMKGGRLLNPQK